MKGKAFVIAGHENWGKSYTVNKIRKNNKRYCIILGRQFWVRGMSNDDKPKPYHEFIKKVDSKKKPLLIATLCPNFDKPNRLTAKILKVMCKKYNIYFWAIKYKYKSNEKIADEQIRKLGGYGLVNVYRGRGEDSERAEVFKKHIARFIQ